jgi:hypothetical protein
LALKAQKQMSDEELREQANVINAYRAGTMSRASDADILKQDREAAMDLMQQIQEQNQANQIGESRREGD